MQATAVTPSSPVPVANCHTVAAGSEVLDHNFSLSTDVSFSPPFDRSTIIFSFKAVMRYSCSRWPGSVSPTSLLAQKFWDLGVANRSPLLFPPTEGNRDKCSQQNQVRDEIGDPRVAFVVVHDLVSEESDEEFAEGDDDDSGPAGDVGVHCVDKLSGFLHYDTARRPGFGYPLAACCCGAGQPKYQRTSSIVVGICTERASAAASGDSTGISSDFNVNVPI
ncbi:unnamed protein product [Phytophthora fragariaefolia]|uniref:Unnamed protein product n=1 Tax=Phytophthora fragariaefolia TaxID=1490495 RepID=A0A9W6XSG4_9STRA|nr:unnamed protein product [Phytophthora fragariaefolia]